MAFIVDTLIESTYLRSFLAGWQQLPGLSPLVGLLKFRDVETMLIHLGFELAPKKSHGDKSGERINSQGDNMLRKHFSQNSELAQSCVGCCTI